MIVIMLVTIEGLVLLPYCCDYAGNNEGLVLLTCCCFMLQCLHLWFGGFQPAGCPCQLQPIALTHSPRINPGHVHAPSPPDTLHSVCPRPPPPPRSRWASLWQTCTRTTR